MPATLLAIPSTKRGSTCAVRVKSLGADCIEKPMADNHKAELRKLLDARRHQRQRRCRANSGATARRGRSIISTSTMRVLLMSASRPVDPHAAALFGDLRRIIAIAEIRRAAATGIYDIRGGGAKRKLPHFDDLLFLGASISRAIRSKAIARNAAPMSPSARGSPKSRSS